MSGSARDRQSSSKVFRCDLASPVIRAQRYLSRSQRHATSEGIHTQQNRQAFCCNSNLRPAPSDFARYRKLLAAKPAVKIAKPRVTLQRVTLQSRYNATVTLHTTTLHSRHATTRHATHEMVRVEGLEPPHLAAAGPKPAASTNSATRAIPLHGSGNRRDDVAKPIMRCRRGMQADIVRRRSGRRTFNCHGSDRQKRPFRPDITTYGSIFRSKSQFRVTGVGRNRPSRCQPSFSWSW